MAHADRRFGVELRHRRTEHDLSLGELAKILHYSKGYLSRIETGERQPSAALARRCDTALGAGGALMEFLPARRRAHRVDVPASSTGIPSELWPRHDHTDIADPVIPRRRRTIDEVDRSGPLAIGAAADSMAADGDIHAGLHSSLALLRQNGRMMPPMLVLPSVVAQFRGLHSLLTSTPARLRPRNLLLAAEFAEFAGWMAEDSGDPERAVEWTRRAAAFAREAGDRDMPAHALVRLASITMYQRNGHRTVALARDARSDSAVSPRIRGMAALREAQGHALLGDELSCRRALDDGGALLAVPRADQLPPLGLSSISDPTALVTGWCMFDLGKPDTSAEVLGAEVGSVPESARRSRSRFGVRLALAQAASGDLEHAVATARSALRDALLVDSATIRTDVRGLAQELARWRQHRVVQEVGPLVREALEAVEGSRH